METSTNLVELHPMLFNLASILYGVGVITGIGTVVAYWREMIDLDFVILVLMATWGIIIGIILIVGLTSDVPVDEILKVLFWFFYQ